MNSIELKSDCGRYVVWACGKCGVVGASKEFIEKCCTLNTCKCGNICSQYFVKCDECVSNSEREKERNRFDRSEKVHWKKYSGPVYLDENGSDGYSSDIDEFFDCFLSNCDPYDAPKYVWACKESRLTLDAVDILHSQLENQLHHDNAFDALVDVDDLQSVMNEWLKKQDMVSYHVDYSRAVVLDVEAYRVAGILGDEDIGDEP